jgi:DNA-binding CsgD family transcriptional regulator
VFSLLAEGHRTADIADLLCITRKTAATHIERILAKLGVHTQAQAVAVALRSRPLEGSIVAGGAPSR